MAIQIEERPRWEVDEELTALLRPRSERAVPHAHTCCIVGGGPAGMMLGLLLARAGIDVVVLEKHSDFLRDFRGDTVHPSTMRVLDDVGLIDEFLALPHSKVGSPYDFVAFVPQWDFLELLAGAGRQLPNFHLLMDTEVTDLVIQQGRV